MSPQKRRFKDDHFQFVKPIHRLSPFPTQIVGLIQDRRDPPLLIERGERNWKFLEKLSRHATLTGASSHPSLASHPDTSLA